MGLVLVVVGGVVLDEGDDSQPVEDSDVGLPGREAADAAGTNLACEPVGCELWRVEESAGGVVVVSDELVVWLSQSGRAAYDVRDGRPVWERTESQRRTSGPVALSEHGLAFVPEPYSHPPQDGWPDDREAFVRVLDLEDGGHRGDVEVALRQVVDLTWAGDRLIAVGQARGDLGDVPAVVVVSPDGQTHWRHMGDASDPFPQHAEDAEILVVQESDEVVGRELRDGHERWRVTGHVAPLVERHENLLVLDRDAGEARLVSREDGHMVQRIPAAGAIGAGRVGPWVAVATGEELRLHDPDDGEEVLRRDHRTPDPSDEPEGPPVRPVTTPAAEIGDRIVVAWPDDARGDDDVELTIHRRDGTSAGTLQVDLPREALRLRLSPVPGAETQAHLHIMDEQGPTSVWLDLDERRVLRVEDGGVEVEHRDQLLALRDDPHLRMVGPNGEIEVLHAPRVASLDPLIVHGMGGILRLDHTLLKP